MERVYDFITFDCYGTLMDWESGIAEAFAQSSPVEGVTLGTAAVLAAYADIEPEVEAETYRTYRAVLTETARRVARRFGWPLSKERASFLADSLPNWRPFTDTNSALRRLGAAGYRLGILLNVDDHLLAGTLRHFSAEFALLVTAQQVRPYHTAHKHFLPARARIRTTGRRHAAPV